MYTVPKHINNNKIFLVKRSELDSRIDPIFYGSDLNKFNKNFPSVKFSSVVSLFKSGVGAGKQDQAEGDEGIIQIRPTNIDNFGNLKFDKNVFLPYGFKGDKLKVDDVLFNNTNSQELVGKTAILLEEKELFYSNHITRIVVDKSQVLPLYIWIILNIYQENKIFYALCTNWNNQSGVGLELLKSLPIPIPPIEIQENIVSIIQNAYAQKQAKEAEAKELLASIDTYLLNELGITLPEKDNSLEARIFTTNFSEVVGGRFDSYYYQKEFQEFFNILEYSSYKVHSLKDISIKITSGITPTSKGDDYVSPELGIPFIRSGNIDINGELNFDELLYLSKEIHNTQMKSSKVLKNDLMIAIVGATIGQVGIYLNEREANINQAIALVRLKNDVNPEYIKETIKSSVGQWNLNRLKRPVARANINLEEISTLRLPLPPLEKQNEIAEHIAEIRSKAKALQQEAEQVLAEAKQRVEQIILGDN